MRRGGSYWYLMGSLLAALSMQVQAKAYLPEGIGDSLPPLLQMAEEQNPELRAANEDSAASNERIQPAGALPDPVLAIELRDIPADNPSLSSDAIGSTRYQLRQSIPWWGKRELRAATATSAAAASKAERDLLRLALRAKVKTVYAQLHTAQSSYKVVDEIKWLVLALEDVAQARYMAGLVPQQDVVKAQAERWGLTNELIGLEAERHHAAGQLNILLGRDSEALLALPKALPAPPAKRLRHYLLQVAMLENSPLLASIEAQSQAAQSNVELARKNRYPDLTVGLASIRRGGRLDAWDLMFEVDIPLQQESRNAREREAAAMVRATEARKQSVRNELLNRLLETRIAYETLAKQHEMLVDTLLPQTELAYQSALAGYQVGKVDFANVLDAQRQLRKIRLDIVKTEYERYLRVVELERLTGKEL